VDLTTPDVATTNVRVARVVVPGLVPNLPAAFPPLGGRRVLEAGVALGWRERPMEEAEVNLLPLPHA
jgi:ribosomal protein S12 methylthiotransferase accessory factor